MILEMIRNTLKFPPVFALLLILAACSNAQNMEASQKKQTVIDTSITTVTAFSDLFTDSAGKATAYKTLDS